MQAAPPPARARVVLGVVRKCTFAPHPLLIRLIPLIWGQFPRIAPRCAFHTGSGW
jgi:hypothetical protein